MDKELNKRDVLLDSIRDKIRNAKNPFLFFDTDTDGAMCYYQLKSLNSNLKGFPYYKDEGKQDYLISKIDESYDLILFFDVAKVDRKILDYCKNREIIWVDHHIVDVDNLVSDFGVLYFNPLDFDSHDNRPCSYWAYILSEDKSNLSYCVVGCVSDFFLLDVIEDFCEVYPDFSRVLINIDENEFSSLFKVIKSNKDFSGNQYEVREWTKYLCFSTRLFELKLFFEMYFKFDFDLIEKTLNDVFNKDIVGLLEEISGEKKEPFIRFAKIKSDIEYHLSECYKKNSGESIAYYFQGRSDMSLSRQISESYINRYREVEVIIVSHIKNSKDNASFSVRSKSVPIRDIYVDELKKLGGVGGGHDLAVGGYIDKKYLDKFVNNFIARCSEFIDKN